MMEKCKYCIYRTDKGCEGLPYDCNQAIEKMMKMESERLKYQNQHTQNKNININKNTRHNNY